MEADWSADHRMIAGDWDFMATGSTADAARLRIPLRVANVCGEAPQPTAPFPYLKMIALETGHPHAPAERMVQPFLPFLKSRVQMGGAVGDGCFDRFMPQLWWDAAAVGLGGSCLGQEHPG